MVPLLEPVPDEVDVKVAPTWAGESPPIEEENMTVQLAKPRLTQPLKWHGGKHYLAADIIGLMPPHLHYVEPYAGGLAVLLAKDPEGISEVVNDLDTGLTNFFRVLQRPETFEPFQHIARAVPFSEIEWQEALTRLDHPDPVERAVAFFIHCRMSLAGRRDTFASLSRTRTRRGMNEQASAWLGAVDGLSAVHARLRRVIVLNQPALDVIRREDGPNTLHYCDPPYVPSTRTAPDTYGPFEMTVADHVELLDTLAKIQGKFLLSGYRSDLYDTAAARAGWKRHDFDLPNNAAGGDTKRRMTESVWSNI